MLAASAAIPLRYRAQPDEGGKPDDSGNLGTHDQSRSRAYHCGEDGLAGISDEKRLCFAIALWNGKTRRRSKTFDCVEPRWRTLAR
jgi:hypothetical protein